MKRYKYAGLETLLAQAETVCHRAESGQTALTALVNSASALPNLPRDHGCRPYGISFPAVTPVASDCTLIPPSTLISAPVQIPAPVDPSMSFYTGGNSGSVPLTVAIPAEFAGPAGSWRWQRKFLISGIRHQWGTVKFCNA